MSRPLELHWNSKLVRWDATSKRFSLVVETDPIFSDHVSEGFAAKHPDRFLTADALALSLNTDLERASMAAMGAVLRPLAAIAELYSEQEDNSFELWIDSHIKETRVTLGQCRAARDALALLTKQPMSAEVQARSSAATQPLRPTISAERNCDVESAARALEVSGNNDLAGRLRRAWAAERSAAHIDLGLAKLTIEQLSGRLASADALIAEYQATDVPSIESGADNSIERKHAEFERAFELINDYVPVRVSGEYENKHERDAWGRWQEREDKPAATGASIHV
jgi:hypothetical protein